MILAWLVSHWCLHSALVLCWILSPPFWCSGPQVCFRSTTTFFKSQPCLPESASVVRTLLLFSKDSSLILGSVSHSVRGFSVKRASLLCPPSPAMITLLPTLTLEPKQMIHITTRVLRSLVAFSEWNSSTHPSHQTFSPFPVVLSTDLFLLNHLWLTFLSGWSLQCF